MIIRKAYKFRLKTNQTISRKLAQFAGSSRKVWNKALAFQKERLKQAQSCLSYAGLTKELTQWKRESDLFFLKEVHSQALQQCDSFLIKLFFVIHTVKGNESVLKVTRKGGVKALKSF